MNQKHDNRMRAARRRAGLSMEALGREVQLSASSINNYETGRRSPKIPVAQRINQYFGLEIFKITSLDDKPPIEI